MDSLRRVATVTTVATLLLITVGALVRASGAGLGCPDWPHCYGRWVPPLSVEDLPPSADRATFNLAKTWTEYLNRLAGVLVGGLVLWTTWRAWSVRKAARRVFPLALGIALLTGFQGWIGGLVVKYELDPRWVTVHLFLALLMLALLIELRETTRLGDIPQSRREAGMPPLLARALKVLLWFSVIQILLGALVRGGLEVVVQENPDLPRDRWIPTLGSVELIHRLLAIALALAVLGFSWRLARSRETSATDRRLAWTAAFLIAAQYGSGVGLHRWALPPTLQVIHITLASWLFAVLFLLHRRVR